jgi:hypothetical protein
MNVYDMKLNDVLWLSLNNTEVLRVPGGWIYRVYDSGTQRECLHSCFVPFNNEFMENSALPFEPPANSGGVAGGQGTANIASDETVRDCFTCGKCLECECMYSCCCGDSWKPRTASH